MKPSTSRFGVLQMLYWLSVVALGTLSLCLFLPEHGLLSGAATVVLTAHGVLEVMRLVEAPSRNVAENSGTVPVRAAIVGVLQALIFCGLAYDPIGQFEAMRYVAMICACMSLAFGVYGARRRDTAKAERNAASATPG